MADTPKIEGSHTQDDAFMDLQLPLIFDFLSTTTKPSGLSEEASKQVLRQSMRFSSRMTISGDGEIRACIDSCLHLLSVASLLSNGQTLAIAGKIHELSFRMSTAPGWLDLVAEMFRSVVTQERPATVWEAMMGTVETIQASLRGFPAYRKQLRRRMGDLAEERVFVSENGEVSRSMSESGSGSGCDGGGAGKETGFCLGCQHQDRDEDKDQNQADDYDLPDRMMRHFIHYGNGPCPCSDNHAHSHAYPDGSLAHSNDSVPRPQSLSQEPTSRIPTPALPRVGDGPTPTHAALPAPPPLVSAAASTSTSASTSASAAESLGVLPIISMFTNWALHQPSNRESSVDTPSSPLTTVSELGTKKELKIKAKAKAKVLAFSAPPQWGYTVGLFRVLLSVLENETWPRARPVVLIVDAAEGRSGPSGSRSRSRVPSATSATQPHPPSPTKVHPPLWMLPDLLPFSIPISEPCGGGIKTYEPNSPPGSDWETNALAPRVRVCPAARRRAQVPHTGLGGVVLRPVSPPRAALKQAFLLRPEDEGGHDLDPHPSVHRHAEGRGGPDRDGASPIVLAPERRAGVVYHKLVVLISHRRIFDERKNQDTLVEAFFARAKQQPRDGQGAVELPVLITKNLAHILEKLSRLMTNDDMAVYIIEYVSIVGSLPALNANFVEEFKTFFAVARALGAGVLRAVAAVLVVAYFIIYVWGLALDLEDLPKHVEFIVPRLPLANVAQVAVDEPTEDKLATICTTLSLKNGQFHRTSAEYQETRGAKSAPMRATHDRENEDDAHVAVDYKIPIMMVIDVNHVLPFPLHRLRPPMTVDHCYSAEEMYSN
ncbi:hypothetical protein BU17DRAFT_100067 [Hysterangium stoloniferum]|nr:hypothetical protein BU17DRAFT_100067 [Hysterangium stoloniferum]